MEYVSTTSLAHEMNLPVNEMFSQLKSMGWIDRKGEKWVLTDIGMEKGGKMKSDPKFGEYVVWPETLTFPTNGATDSQKLLNPTAIGKHFNVSSQRINLILSELGLIENDVAGWILTKIGKHLGGKQFKHDQSGKIYVLWPQSILANKSVLQVFNLNETALQTKSETDLNKGPVSGNFRHKYPAEYQTLDGHFVRSKSEKIIDDWLYISGLVHSYEKQLPTEEVVISDFYIPSGNGRPQSVYIEFWGLSNEPKYQERMKAKIAVYKKNDMALIELFESDIQKLDDVLPRKLLEFKIKVG